jgi:hypothetical protein
MKASDYTSSYLTADDVRKPKLLNVEQVAEETIGNDSKPKLVLYGRDDSEGDEHKIALNKSNISRLIEIFGTDETDDWVGSMVVVFRDPNVMFNNRKVGGIAFKKAPPVDTSFEGNDERKETKSDRRNRDSL